MPRPKSTVPAVLIHRPTGQARVRIGGKDHYLGPAGSPEADERYRRFVAEFLTSGAVAAAGRSTGSTPPQVSVNELILAYVRFAEGYYRKDGRPTSELGLVKDTLRFLRQHYGTSSANKFGPLKLKSLREAMVARGWCRGSINQRIGRVKRVFRWGVENELLPPSVSHGLAAVAGLRHGRTEAKESAPIRPIADADVNAALPHLSRQAKAMVMLQSFTGMRPGEVCTLRPCDVNRDGDVWEFRPASHKTQHHGRERIIFIGPRARRVLAPWLDDRPADAFCFSPAEAEEERRAAVHAGRRTPLSCGNRPGTNRSRKPKRPPGDRYLTAAYRRAIERACELAGVAPWGPNRLRHSAATAIRRAYGLEAAQCVLGHSDADVTQIYAERNADLARKVAAEMG